MLLPSLTNKRAHLLRDLRIGELSEPCKIAVNWLSYNFSDNTLPIVNEKIHQHTFFEVHFVLHGSVSYLIEDGAEYKLSEGDCLIISPTVHHTILTPKCTRLGLTFLPATDSALYAELSKKSACAFKITDNMCRHFEDILIEAERGGFLSHSIIRARIFDIICEIARAVGINEHHGTHLSINTGGEVAIERACAYIRDNRNRMLNCLEVSRHCHFNEKYLGRLFKLKTGMTMLAYIHDQKIKYAEELLRDETLSLKAVSERLGFANEYYFNSFFKRINGITPGQFRKLI